MPSPPGENTAALGKPIRPPAAADDAINAHLSAIPRLLVREQAGGRAVAVKERLMERDRIPVAAVSSREEIHRPVLLKNCSGRRRQLPHLRTSGRMFLKMDAALLHMACTGVRHPECNPSETLLRPGREEILRSLADSLEKRPNDVREVQLFGQCRLQRTRTSWAAMNLSPSDGPSGNQIRYPHLASRVIYTVQADSIPWRMGWSSPVAKVGISRRPCLASPPHRASPHENETLPRVIQRCTFVR